MTPRSSPRAILAIVVVALLLLRGAPVLAGESSLRERYPNDVTSTPTPDGVLGDGTALSTEESAPAPDPSPTTNFVVTTDTPPPTDTAGTSDRTATERVTEAAIVPVQDPPKSSDTAADSVVRPKPTARTYDNPAANPASRAPKIPRLDDPVLRWLPEIMASAGANDVPPELIAGVMRIESDGNPNIISPDGARGLMQIMPDQLLGQGISEEYWHDPATNIMAGGYELLERSWSYGSWEGAVGSYFGFGCDVFGTCTDVYIAVVFGWAAYYAPIITSPLSFGFAVLPDDWVPPPIEPFVEAAPVPVEEAPPPPAPTEEPSAPPATATATPAETPTDEAGAPTSEPTGEPTDAPTGGPTEVPTDVPTDVPTAEPTGVPTDVPTEVPTEEPTAEPTEVPTDAPTDVPTDEPTDAPTDPPADAATPDTTADGG